MISSRNEQGNILLYAVIAITFLAGLSMYLQKMSDPMLFQTNDTKKLLTAEYLTSSSSMLLSEIAYNDSAFPKCSGTCISSSGDEFKNSFTKIINRYQHIYIFSNKDSLLASVTRDGDFTKEQINPGQDDTVIFFDQHVHANQKYTIQPYIGNKTEKTINIDIKF